MRGMRRRVPARIEFGQGRRSLLKATLQQVLERYKLEKNLYVRARVRLNGLFNYLGGRWNPQSPVMPEGLAGVIEHNRFPCLSTRLPQINGQRDRAVFLLNHTQLLPLLAVERSTILNLLGFPCLKNLVSA